MGIVYVSKFIRVFGYLYVSVSKWGNTADNIVRPVRLSGMAIHHIMAIFGIRLWCNQKQTGKRALTGQTIISLKFSRWRRGHEVSAGATLLCIFPPSHDKMS